MYNKIIFILFIWLFAHTLIAQNLYINWSNSIGFPLIDERFSDVAELSDGYYLAVGQTSKVGSLSFYDWYAVKFNSLGDTIWTKIYAGDSTHYANAVCATNNGGAIIVGYTTSSASGDVPENKGLEDLWAIKINKEGNIIWTKTWGGSLNEEGLSITKVSDNKYVIGAFTESSDGDLTGNVGKKDLWLIATDTLGNIIWQKTYGGSNDEAANSLTYQLNTNEIIVGGYTSSANTQQPDGVVSFNHGARDVWMLKINADNGDLNFEKTYGGSLSDIATSIIQNTNGGFLLLGDALSSDGDLTQNYGQDDIWLLSINSDNEIIWQKTYGTAGFNSAGGLVQTLDGNLTIAGTIFDSNPVPPATLYDAWLLKVKGSDGHIIIDKKFGGSQFDFANAIILTNKQKPLIAGFTDSVDGDLGKKNDRHGSHQAWIFELNEDAAGIIKTKPNLLNINYNKGFLYFENLDNLLFNNKPLIKIFDAQGKVVFEQILSSLNLIELNLAHNPLCYVAALYVLNEVYSSKFLVK